MASLQEQIDFIRQEHNRCKLVYSFLLQEFGEKNIYLLDKEVSEKLHFSRAIIQSLQELKTFKAQPNGSKR